MTTGTTAAPERAPVPAGTSRAEPPRPGPTARLARLALDRLYNPDPGEGMLRHIAIAVAIALVQPLPGFLLLIATLIRGPLPKLTIACAVLAAAGLAVRAASLLTL